MNLTISKIAFATSICILSFLTGCSSTTAQKAERSTGLVDFVSSLQSDVPASDALPVVRTAHGRGTVASATVANAEMGFLVKGTVKRTGLIHPHNRAHVDVLLCDKQGRVVEGKATLYQPRIPSLRQRGKIVRTQFQTTLLTANPSPGSWVKTAFHDAEFTECPYARKS